MMDKNALKKTIGQAIRFGLVGVINTLVDWGVFALLDKVLKIGPAIAQAIPNIEPQVIITFTIGAISYTCGLICSFILNKSFTFKDKQRSGRQVVVFIVVNLVAFSVSLAMINYVFLGWLNVGDITLAKILSTPFSLAVNFIGNKLFVFKDKSSSTEDNGVV